MSPRHLLWVDCAAGALAGAAVLALSGWLSAVEGLPQGVLVVTGVANLVYAAGSFSLAVRAARSAWAIALLAAANVAWGGVCAALAVTFADGTTAWAFVHLLGEGAVVAALGATEWQYREVLRTRP